MTKRYGSDAERLPDLDKLLVSSFNLDISHDEKEVEGQEKDIQLVIEYWAYQQTHHIHGHSLDLMIFSSGCNVLSVSTSDLISDHFSVFADLQNYLQLLLCPVVLIIAINICTVLPTLTSQGFSLFRTDWPAWGQSLLHLLAAFHCFVTFIGCQ